MRTFYSITELFEMARMNPSAPINQAGRLQGRHCVARKLRAQACRKAGRVKANKRHREGRMVYSP